jgi:hypothetical protein
MRKRKLITAPTTRCAARATVLATALGLTLAACGGSKSGTANTSSSAAAPASTSSSSASPSASSKATTGGTTAPGTNLALGAPALVDYQPGDAPHPTYHLQVSVLSIQKGAKSDLNGVELEKSQQGQTPYYVRLSIRNVGAGDAGAEDNEPAVAFQATDDRGEQGQELTVLGNFRPCENGTQPKPFTRGKIFQTCVIYMVGGGGSIVQENWTGSGGDEYGEKPIVWKAG